MSESEWHDRPIEEKSYLDDKIEKLSVFLHSTIFATSAIDEDEKALLRLQFKHMKLHACALNLRIAKHEGEWK
jgi:hypothetical protein